jgi:hypothetical protein
MSYQGQSPVSRLLASVRPEMKISFECKARGSLKSGAYSLYVSISRQLSNAARGRKDYFWMDTRELSTLRAIRRVEGLFRLR